MCVACVAATICLCLHAKQRVMHMGRGQQPFVKVTAAHHSADWHTKITYDLLLPPFPGLTPISLNPRHVSVPLCASLCVCPPLPPQVISMIKSSALCGSAIIAYLQAKGYPEVRLAEGGLWGRGLGSFL